MSDHVPRQTNVKFLNALYETTILEGVLTDRDYKYPLLGKGAPIDKCHHVESGLVYDDKFDDTHMYKNKQINTCILRVRKYTWPQLPYYDLNCSHNKTHYNVP